MCSPIIFWFVLKRLNSMVIVFHRVLAELAFICTSGENRRTARREIHLSNSLRTPSISVRKTLRMVSTPAKKKSGLALWMQLVLDEFDRVGAEFAPDPVHDLRVALRRCRSVADSFILLDPNPAWKQMKKAGRSVFRSLGELRDVQVTLEWITRLAGADDDVAASLTKILLNREIELKAEAARALPEFDRKQWAKWSVALPRRANKIRKGGIVFKNLALERYAEAHRLHQLALRNRSKVAFHNLRIGIKRFRYIVENFLPEQYGAWKSDLKELQDLLGEVHDLDVLWATLVQTSVLSSVELRSRWNAKIVKERTRRVNQYRAKMLGKTALWQVWRKGLPQLAQIEASALARLKVWAAALDPDFPQSQRACRLALRLFDKMPAQNSESEPEKTRAILQTAALLHDVGRSRKERGHHKATYRLVEKLRPFPGRDSRFLHVAATVARYHRGILPGAGQRALHNFSLQEKQQIAKLAGLLRLASALENVRAGSLPALEIEDRGASIVIALEGYSSLSKAAGRIAAARHLLETVVRRPILIRALVSRHPSPSIRKTSPKTGSLSVTPIRKTS